MSVSDLMRNVALLSGLSEAEVEAVAGLCAERSYPAGSIILRQGEPGDEFYIIQDGQVEISLVGDRPERLVVVLGKGQILGEMSLLDRGHRSATARAAAPTTVQVIKRADFAALCERDHHIGYLVMRNLAADLAFKIRHVNLAIL